MAKVKIKTRISDRLSGEIHEPSDKFVEVSEAFAQRIKEIQKDPRHKDNFEWEKAKDDKPRSNKGKGSDKLSN